MNEQECWKVKVVWKSGRETRDCYSTASGLLIATAGLPWVFNAFNIP